MSSYKKTAALLSVMCLAAGLVAAPAARPASARARAIDLLAEGQTLENQGNTQAAYQKYYESVQAAASPSAYYHLGRIARLSGQKDAARQYLNQALTLNPTFELAKVELMQMNAGAANAGAVVKTVSGELRGDLAPGSTTNMATNINQPMNVEALRREVVTMQSLAPPNNAGASGTGPASISSADEPAPPEPATPQDIILEEPPGDNASEDGPINSEVSDLLSPTIDPMNDEPVSLPSLAQAPGAKAGAAAANTAPSRADINDAAFGDESQKDPGSLGYGETSKVVLGTFAFHREKGDQYRTANRHKEAAVEYKTALEVSPTDAETRTLLAEMYGRIGDSNKAETQFEKAKAVAPADDRIYYKEGNTYFDEQKYDLAIGSYTKALDLNPSNKFAQNNLGVAYMEKKNYSKAAEKFKKVLELDAAYDMAVLNLGIIYDEHIVDKEQALKYYDRYLELKGPRATEVQRWADSIRARAAN